MRFDYYKIVPRWMKNGSPIGGSYNYAYYLIHPWRLASDWYYQCKWFLQRGHRGYADCDVWGWCSYMARVNAAALHRLASSKYGHPCGMTQPGWRSRLAKMADGFEAFTEDENDCTSYRRLSRREHARLVRDRERRTAKGLGLWAKHFWSLWD